MRLPVSHHPRRIASHIARLGPWYSRFVVDGQAYGGEVGFDDDWRIRQFDQAFPEARTVLELGSFEGGQSFVLARRRGARVLAVEGRAENIARARYVQRLLGAGNIRFVHADLERVPLRRFGRFDAVVCSGLLYHLPRPRHLLDQLADVSDGVFIWTHYADASRVDDVVDGMPGHWYTELGRADPLSGLSPRSFWVTLPALVDVLRANGFAGVEVIQDDRTTHPNGPCVSLAARRQPSAGTTSVASSRSSSSEWGGS